MNISQAEISIDKFQREKDLFITLFIVYIQISNSYLPEFLNILLYIQANPVWMCRQCLYSAVIFNSKLGYYFERETDCKYSVVFLSLTFLILLV